MVAGGLGWIEVLTLNLYTLAGVPLILGMMAAALAGAYALNAMLAWVER